jgi:hypothetical protein
MSTAICRTRLLGAIGVSLCSAVVAWGQPSISGALPGALRAHLQGERFEIVTSIRGLPLGVREDLGMLFGSGALDIAEPGAEFERTGGAGNRQLPPRRLVAAGCSKDFHCLVHYERGGTTPTWHVMLFRWTPAATRFEWGGAASNGLATIEDVRKAVVSGAIKGHAGPW